MFVEVLKAAIGKPLKGYEDRPQWEVDLFLVMVIYVFYEEIGRPLIDEGDVSEIMKEVHFFGPYAPEKPGDHWAYRAPEVVKHYIDVWGKMAEKMGLEPIASWAKPK